MGLCLPTKILQNHCFQFLLRNIVVLREVEDNDNIIFLFFGGGGGGRETRGIMIYVKMVNRGISSGRQKEGPCLGFVIKCVN